MEGGLEGERGGGRGGFKLGFAGVSESGWKEGVCVCVFAGGCGGDGNLKRGGAGFLGGGSGGGQI